MNHNAFKIMLDCINLAGLTFIVLFGVFIIIKEALKRL